MRSLPTSILLFLLIISSVTAADFKKGVIAYESGDFKTAFQEWYSLAEEGDVSAQYNIALMYDSGKGVAKDVIKAFYWYKEAAEQGHAKAQFSLGLYYDMGRGVPEDDAKAVYWYKEAAEQGHAKAQHTFGNVYDFGQGGVAKDEAKALFWYKKAAEQGHVDSQYNVGSKYYNGEGVAKDEAKALFWYKKAAEQGHVHSQHLLGNMYEFGEVVDSANSQSTSVGVAKDLYKAVYWYRKAAEQGHIVSQFNLANMYEGGKGVPEDDAKAVYWYRKAAEQEYARAQFNLGIMYSLGDGVPEDYVISYMWVNLAAAKGHEKAQTIKDLLQKRMTKSQISEAQRLSREWKPGQSSEIPKRAATVPLRKQISPDATGSSFVVSANGDVLTNRHVVVGCNRLKVGGQNTKVIAQDPNNDLALLRVGKTTNSVASFREGRGARVGDKVSAAGYPLRGILGDSLNVGFGNISSLTGIRNDSRLFQISAPVNLGNSGGPLLDHSGNIIGVVTSKLNALFVAKEIGDIPQGANFAIKSSIVRIFLDLNNVDYETAPSRNPKTTTKIADEAQKYTLLVECWK